MSATAPLVTFGVSWALLFLMVGYWRVWLPLDRPNARSLHQHPIPRAGGLGILLGVLTGWTVAGAWHSIWLLMTLALAVVSWIDDRHGLPVAVRLGAQSLTAIMFLWLFGNGLPWWFLAFAAIGLVWITNLYNFMDGADGLAGGMTISGFGAYAIAAWAGGEPQVSVVSSCLVAGALAFLMFNFPPAKIFMGDVGSVPLGFLAAALGFHGWREGIWPVWFPIMVFSPFIVDATFTLLRRLARGERFWEAHKEHAYQKLIRSGWSHRRLVAVAWPLMALAAVTAVVLRTAPALVVAGVLAVWTCLYLILLVAVEVRWRRAKTTGRGVR